MSEKDTRVIDNAPQTAAVLNIPVSEDVPVIMDILQMGYEEVEDEYERSEPGEMSEQVARQGSLCEELFAQLSKQGFSRFD